MQYIKHPTDIGFYWFKRPPETKGWWWQKKEKIVYPWEMVFVNKETLIRGFAVRVGPGPKRISFNDEGDWFGPIILPDDLEEMVRDQEFLKQQQAHNFERASRKANA